MTTPPPFIKHLAYNTYAAGKSGQYENGCSVTVMSPAAVDDGVFIPAESVDVNTLPGVIALRDLCNEVIAKHEELNKPKDVKGEIK